jgi:hypothetical protein
VSQASSLLTTIAQIFIALILIAFSLPGGWFQNWDENQAWPLASRPGPGCENTLNNSRAYEMEGLRVPLTIAESEHS